MKIAVLVYSRYRPKQLTTLLSVLEGTCSDQNEVRYYVTYCPGDQETIDAISQLSYVIGIPRENDNVMLGEAINTALSNIHDTFDPDYYTPMADDVIPCAPHWDKMLERMDTNQYPVCAWNELNDPENTAYISFSRKYYKAIAPYAVPSYFPFWFIDTWQREVYHLAFGPGFPLCNSLVLAGRRGKTQGLRNVEFWFRYFAKLRPMRIEQARNLATHFDIPVPDMTEVIMELEKGDQSQIERCPHYEKLFGSTADIQEPYYDRAFADALEHLKALKLGLV